MGKPYAKVLVICMLSTGLIFLLSRDFPSLSMSQVVISQKLIIKDLPEGIQRNNSLNAASASSNASNISIENPFISRNIAETTPTEVRHIGFLKVHKAGSSTMQNMFFRFGLKRNLTFVIPKTGNYFSVSSTLAVKNGSHYDILAVHTHAYYKGHFDKMLPPDKVMIGIVREPLDRMISAAYYYRDVFNYPYLTSIPKDDFIQELVSHPEKYDKDDFSFTKNSMGKDFGFLSSTRELDMDRIVNKLKNLEAEFRLVLVMERFEESLILLKRYLSWQVSDILFIPSNAHEHVKQNLTEEQKLKHKHTCFLDYAIYTFFSKLFDYKVKAEGADFQDEVRNFRDILQKTNTFCTQPLGERSTLIVKASKWNSEFEVSRYDCELMLLPELAFIGRLRTRHIQMNKVANETRKTVNHRQDQGQGRRSSTLT